MWLCAGATTVPGAKTQVRVGARPPGFFTCEIVPRASNHRGTMPRLVDRSLTVPFIQAVRTKLLFPQDQHTSSRWDDESSVWPDLRSINDLEGRRPIPKEGSELKKEAEVPLRIVLVATPAGVDFGIQEGKGSDYKTIQKNIPQCR